MAAAVFVSLEEDLELHRMLIERYGGAEDIRGGHVRQAFESMEFSCSCTKTRPVRSISQLTIVAYGSSATSA